jgi:hypothetical protein
MTEFDLQERLFARFKDLNLVSGINFLNDNNVHYPNESFSIPNDNRWFDLNIVTNEPENVSLLDDSQERINGVLYVDINTPLDVGEDEAKNIYKHLKRLFNNFKDKDILINKCYVSHKESGVTSYSLQVAIEWEADIDKEI